MQKKKVLIVEDEKELVKLITFHLSIAGYDVLSAGDGIKALEVCRESKPDLVILDIMLPRIDGWEVCRRLRQDIDTRNIPVIMLSALSEVDDKLRGFGLGIDDYVTKPFSPRELVVRVKRVLARSEQKSVALPVLKTEDLEIDPNDMDVKRDETTIQLTEKEKGILKLFVNNPGKVLSHSEILDAVWDEDAVVEFGNIDVHIRHLREKLEHDPDNPKLIRTIRKEGYKFEP